MFETNYTDRPGMISAMRDLPVGTVTFLFTDIEGSTRLLDDLGVEDYAERLAEHRRVLRGAFERHGGIEVDTQGDAFFIAFPTAPAALAAAREAQAGLDLPVRMGLHTGTPRLTDEGYAGFDVHRAARIAAAGHGGQVLVSTATAALVNRSELRDLGEHRLKDMGAPERIFQLGEQTFPPLRTLDTTNLPVAPGRLLGREREEAELVELLGDRRLITITGPGGAGKTRLALQVAAELVGVASDGVFWVPLAPLSDPDLVDSEIAHAVGAPDDLGGFLHGRELLLLLDNFEHVLAAAPRIAELLAAAAGLRVLVTSRAPLRIAGELEYSLEPLSPTDAADLFVERARAAGGGELEPDATVGAVCARLDRLPLAIELAAARTRLLSPEALLERLEQALPLLTDGARDAPERQRTLRATIEWSFDLLDADGRQLLARLGVFAGGFRVEAAEAVCEATLGGLSALLELSLLKQVGDDRLLLLETVREFARERLTSSGEEEAVRARHAAEFARLAETAYALRHEDEAEASSRLDRNHDDLRAALDRLTRTAPDEALKLAGSLGWFWLTHGHLAEGDTRLRAALKASTAGGRVRARALTAFGALAARSGRVDEGRQRLEEAIAGWIALDDQAETAGALEASGWLLVYDAGDDSAALAAFEQARSIRQALGDRPGETRALVGVCQVLVAIDDPRAESLAHELLELGKDDLRTTHFAIHFLADCSLIRGDCAQAEERYRESLRAALALGDVFEASVEVQGLAMAIAGQGDSARSLELAAAVERLWRSLGTDLHVAFWDRLLERYLSPARLALGSDAEAARARGLELPFEEAVELALGGPN